MKLLVDMNLSPRWTAHLASAHLQAVHWSAVGAATAADREIAEFARANGYIVLTHDLDFGAILAATGARGPSVIQLRSDDVRPECAGSAVVQAVRQCASELGDGALLTVDAQRLRVTLLPLRR